VLIFLLYPGSNFVDPYRLPAGDCSSCKPQLGSYFGGSLLSMDLNADGKDDLLVGAPLHIGQHYDQGKVFVYISQRTNSVMSWVRSLSNIKIYLFRHLLKNPAWAVVHCYATGHTDQTSTHSNWHWAIFSSFHLHPQSSFLGFHFAHSHKRVHARRFGVTPPLELDILRKLYCLRKGD